MGAGALRVKGDRDPGSSLPRTLDEALHEQPPGAWISLSYFRQLHEPQAHSSYATTSWIMESVPSKPVLSIPKKWR